MYNSIERLNFESSFSKDSKIQTGLHMHIYIQFDAASPIHFRVV